MSGRPSELVVKRQDPRAQAGTAEMPERVARHAWEGTPLGPRDRWPRSLATAAGICLHSRFPLWIGWGPDLIMIYNDGFKEVLQIKHPWALGRPTREVWSEVWDVIGPMLSNVLKTGEATWSDDQLLVLERTGTPEECYFTWSYSPIQDDQGGIGGVFTTVKETTERVLGERRLRTLRELGLQSGESSPAAAANRAVNILGDNPYDLPFAAIYLTAPDGNSAALAGAVGLPPGSDACPPQISLDDPGAAWPLRRTTAARGGPEIVPLPKEGRFPMGPWDRPPSVAAVLPLSGGPEGPPLGFMVAGLSPLRPIDAGYKTFLDLAARHVATAIANARALDLERRRVEALAQLDKAKTEFFNNISHEFRTPLTLMLGPLGDALRVQDLQPSLRGALEIAERNSLRLLKLVNNLLDFSRLEAGRMKATFAPIPFSELVTELASGFRSLMERADLRFEIDCRPLPRAVYADRDLLERILLNLLGNAFKFTPTGSVRVSTRDEDGHAVLEVSDTGIGIPAAALPRIFERFHRVEGARGRSMEGSGIGLSLVKELAALHGGTVEVASVENRGTTFTVRLPYGPEHLPPGQIVDAAPTSRGSVAASAYVDEASRWLVAENGVSHSPAPGEAGAATLLPAADRDEEVLLVDDNADMRDYLRRLLSERWRVKVASDGHEALAAARERRPSLILSDIMMPRMDGFELLRHVRSDPSLQDTPVILLSARAGEEARVEGLDRGADDYLVKPFTARELIARVNTHLSIRRARSAAMEIERGARASLEQTNRQLDRRVRRATRILRERNKKLEEANASLARLSYVLGHDLQEPARAVGTALHVLRVDHGDQLSEPARHLLGFAEQATQRLGRLVTGLLELSRAANTPLGAPEALKLSDAIAHPLFVNATRSLVEGKNARLLIEGGDSALFASPPEVARVLAQLVRNAVQHTGKPGPAIWIRGKERSEETVVTVEDDGPGIPEARLKEFNEGGLGAREGGFGLAVSRRAVERMGGTLRLVNPDHGGARVVVSLPRLAPSSPAGQDLPAVDDTVDAPDDYESLLRSIPGAFLRSEPLEPFRFHVLTPQVEAITGYPAADFTSGARSWVSIIHPEDLERAWRDVRPSLEGKGPYSTEYRIHHARGGLRWVLVRGNAVQDTAGRVVAVEGLVLDVTNAKQAEADLLESRARYKETSEDLTTFTNSVSHDLRAPLRMLDHYLSELRAALSGTDDPELKELAEQAFLENQRGIRLVNALLAFSRGAHKPLERREVDVSRLCQELARELDSSAPARKVEWRIAPGLSAYADEGLLRILLRTLLDNGAKYSSGRPDPHVEVTGQATAAATRIVVRDNGVGFPPEEASQLFLPFSRLSSGQGFEGTGLGLATAMRIAARHGGAIRASSRPGDGAAFELSLPRRA